MWGTHTNCRLPGQYVYEPNGLVEEKGKLRGGKRARLEIPKEESLLYSGLRKRRGYKEDPLCRPQYLPRVEP